MPLPAEKFREMVFQMLYSYDFSPWDEKEMIELIMNELKITKKSALLASERVKKIVNHLNSIDALIRKASIDYQFERISRVEKNIIRLGIFELCYDEEIPKKVAIAESVRLCRKFGTRESADFVNAIMDSVYKGAACPSKSDCAPIEG